MRELRKSVKLKEIDRILQENRELKNKNRKLTESYRKISAECSQLIEENTRLRNLLYVFAKSGFKDKTIPGWYFYEVMKNDK